jgi:hypothetical protein
MSAAAKRAHASIPCHHPSLHLPVPRKRFVGIDCTAVIQIEDHQTSAARSAAGRISSQILVHYWNAGIVTENAKRPDDLRSRLSLSNETTPDNSPSGEASPLQDAEAQMRRALGLYAMPRRPDAERAAAPMAPRQADRFGASGQRRRFAQDGEVPVTVVHGRRDHPVDAPVNRLEAAETVAAAERTGREQAERALAEAQATIHDLRTKLGHASLAQTELQAAARRDQDVIATVQAELLATSERLATMDAARKKLQQRLSAIEDAYADEQSARQQAERAQRDAEAGRTVAERRLRQLDLTAGEPVERTARRPGRPAKATNAKTPVKPRETARRGEVQPRAGVPEPEPVQWWLTSAKKTQRR